MNLFKGPLYLHDPLPTVRPYADTAPRYGAARAWREFAPDLGNRAAAERWFERRDGSDRNGDSDRPALVRRVAVAGGRFAQAVARTGRPAAALRTPYRRTGGHPAASHAAASTGVCANC